MPDLFGNWSSIYKHFNAWSTTGKWLKVFHALLEEPDFEWSFINDTYVKAHQHSTGAASSHSEGLGKSHAGLTSKIHLTVDAQGLPVAFEVTGGGVHDSSVASKLIIQLPCAEVIVADKGYDSECIRDQIKQQGGRPVIPRKRNSTDRIHGGLGVY